MKFDRRFWSGVAVGATVYAFGSAAVHMVGNQFNNEKEKAELAECYQEGAIDVATVIKQHMIEAAVRQTIEARFRQIALRKTCRPSTPQQ